MTVRIGILGAARVAAYAMIAPASEMDGVTVAGIAARDPARARHYATAHGIPDVYETYDALINAPDIDAVYIALPPNLHAHWSIAALHAGKPVLCEKPFALSTADARAMLAAEAKSGLLLMEAQHSRYHPLLQRAIDTVQSGAIGAMQEITATFTAPLDFPENDLRLFPDIGGGALWDLGVYPAFWIRAVSGMEPHVVSATHRLMPSGADMATEASLAFPTGAMARLVCDMAAEIVVTLDVTGTKGTLSIINPVSPQRGHRFTLTTDSTVTETFPTKATYAYQLEAFRNAIRDKTAVPTRGADSLATIGLLEQIQAAARAAH